ncbi:MAG: ribosome assembly factor SBDS [Nanohaloarchaea archaeon]|nr:ribosome assembly factor SBDS [Candidatus Nanohaloarchaea archaeon]
MSVDHIIAKISFHGKDFEIIVDSEKIKDYKSGKISDINDILIVDGIFRNLRKVKSLDKGMLFKDNKTVLRIEDTELNTVFNTTDLTAIAKKIITDGEIQYTTEQRKEFLERKQRSVINIIANQSIDPRTGAPHTAARIESAMKQVRVSVDIHRSAESQVQDIIRSITSILPIKLEFKEIEIKTPIKYAGHLKKIMLDFGQVKNENWLGNNYIAMISIGAGQVDTFLGKVNGLTHGETICRIIN